MRLLRFGSSVVAIVLCAGTSFGQTLFAKILAVATKVGPEYNVSATTQAQLNQWLINQPAENYLVTSYRNELVRYPATGGFQTGTLHVVLTAVVDGKLGDETITIDSQTTAGTPDNGVRGSINSITFETKAFATYQGWLAAAQSAAGGFLATDLVHYRNLAFKGPAGKLLLGPSYAPNSGGGANNTFDGVTINQPLSFSMKLGWESKVP